MHRVQIYINLKILSQVLCVLWKVKGQKQGV